MKLSIGLLLLAGIAAGQVTVGPQNANIAVTAKVAYLYAYGVQGAVAVFFPTWSDENGQDDMVMYPAVSLGNGTWRATVDLSQHVRSPATSMTVTTHVYMLSISMVRLGEIAWSVSPMVIAEVSGLQPELDLRILRGGGFVAGRTATINSGGGIDAVAGSPTDCVRVDGTSSPCSMYAVIDRWKLVAIATSLSMASLPVGDVAVYLNGVLLYPAEDYNLNGTAIDFTRTLTAGDLVQALYTVQTPR